MGDEAFMCRALELAAKGFTGPNPMVGCVVVKGGKVVAEGFHKKAGEPHAEVNALRVAGARAEGSTLYVNLEPCSHFGKTPPCVDAIIEAGVMKVVAAMKDPNPLVAGKGFKKLRKAGVKVKVGVLEGEARAFNEAYIHFIKTGRPFVALKVAASLDGFISNIEG